MNTFKNFLAAAGLAGVALALSAASAAAQGPTCEDGPISLGSVSTVTGVVDFSDAPKAAAARLSMSSRMTEATRKWPLRRRAISSTTRAWSRW